MIPKVIHYCWFGNNPKSEIIQKCIDSWFEYCPDYEIIEWNENNFDVNSIAYTRDAYAAKKWAFVSDYARLWVIYNFGGIYLDTDVLLHNKLDDLLQYDCWMASDDVRYIASGLGFGAISNFNLIGKLMSAYNNYVFPAGTNVMLDTKIIESELPEWKKSDVSQLLSNNIYFIGMKDYGKFARHLYAYSWGDKEAVEKREHELLHPTKKSLRKIIMWKFKCKVRNPKIINFFDKRKGSFADKVYTFMAYDFLDNGPIYFAKLVIKKIFKIFRIKK